MKIILASSSPRRIELLKSIVTDFEVIPSSFDESTVKNKEFSPDVLTKKLAYFKANDVFNKYSNSYKDLIVIGADTVVSLDNTILGKPTSKDDAFNMLKLQSGKEVFIYTGMCIISNFKNDCFISKSSVKFKSFSDNEILNYINSGEPMDKAGAWAIQGIGNKLINSYEGNLNTIIGLDTDLLKQVLSNFI